MVQSIFNTLLIKSNHELINDIKDDIIVINEDKSTTLKLTNFENENLQFDCDCQVGTDFILLRFNTYNTVYTSSVHKWSIQFPKAFFILTVTSIMDGESHSMVGFDSAFTLIDLPVVLLNDDRQPVYYDKNEIAWKLKKDDSVTNQPMGRCFRNPMTLIIDALINNKFKW